MPYDVLIYAAYKYNKSQKFVLLLQQLQQKNGAFAGDLKAEFDLDDRTLRRYIKDLKELSLPIKKKRDITLMGHKDQRIWLDAKFQRITDVQVHKSFPINVAGKTLKRELRDSYINK